MIIMDCQKMSQGIEANFTASFSPVVRNYLETLLGSLSSQVYSKLNEYRDFKADSEYFALKGYEKGLAMCKEIGSLSEFEKLVDALKRNYDSPRKVPNLQLVRQGKLDAVFAVYAALGKYIASKADN
jgi:predicted nucleotide-binding protein (sugar kinase/HSP70/actin superfamily)